MTPGTPEGRTGICFINGREVKGGRHRKTRAYLRISKYWYRAGEWVVAVGLSDEEAKARLIAAQREVEAFDREKRAKAAAEARRKLKEMISSEDDFKRELVRSIRIAVSIFGGMDRKPSGDHAYTLSIQGAQEIVLSLDAVVEAVMGAEVDFDQARHQQLMVGYEKTIRKADPGFYAHLEKLTVPNPSLLAGEAT